MSGGWSVEGSNGRIHEDSGEHSPIINVKIYVRRAHLS